MKNVVLLTIDSLRADHAVQEQDLMPNLSTYAERGVRFEHAYANGYATPASFPTILTGTYAVDYGGKEYMSDDRPFIAREFNESGYDTAGFNTNPLLRAEKNYDVGFETYSDFRDEAGKVSHIRHLITQNLDSDSQLYKLLKRVYHIFRTSSGSRDYTPAPELNDLALDWIDHRDRDRPFLLWSHYMDVHYPFYPPDEFLDEDISRNRALSVNGRMHESDTELNEDDVEDLRALYRGEVRYMDHYLEEFIYGLQERGLYEDTVFVVTSDHGELFDDHGIFGHPPAGYDESFHVPLVLFGPGIPEGESVGTTISHIDLPPTLAALAGINAEPDWEGTSLESTIRNDSQSDRELLFGDDEILAYQSEGMRLVWWKDSDHPQDSDCEWELLRVGENEPIPVDENEALVTEYRERIEAFCERANQERTLSEPNIDGSTKDRLRALGYK